MWYKIQVKGLEATMEGAQFSQIRRTLGKSQRQLARLLGVSAKAIQSFEQGWRRIPSSAERQLLLLLCLKSSSNKASSPCWAVRRCSDRWKANCPSWEFNAGRLCWLVNGTFCRGQLQESWQKKMELCQGCEVYLSIFGTRAGSTGPSEHNDATGGEIKSGGS